MPCQRSLWAEVEASVHGACSAGGLLAASPKVLLFMPVGAKHAARVNHTCTTALEAGFDLFLVHYDGQKAAYEQYPWYAKAAFTAQLSHTNKFHHVAHALLRQPQLLTTVVAQYTHVLTADEDVRFPPPLALQRFAALVHAMRVPIAQPLVVKEGGGEAIVNSLSYDELRSRVDYGAIRPACDTARLVDWVETLMPIMPPCVLLELVGRYHNDAALTSYGLDMIWCRAATSLLWTRARHPPQPQPYFCAIVDGVVFVQGSANVIADYPKTSYSWNSAHSDRQCAREHAPKHCWSHLDVWGCSLGDEPHVSPPTSKWTGFVAATNPVVSARLLPAAPDADAQSVARAHFKSGAHEHEAPGGHHSRAAVTVQALAGKSPSNELIAQVGALLHPQDDYRVTSCHHGQGSKESLGRLLHEPATRAWAEYAPSASLNEWAVRMDGCITPEAGSFVPPRATKAADAGSRPAPSCCRPKRNSSQGSWVAPTVWAPRCVAEARYSWHDFAGALSCLAGRLLIFEGNSLARQLFMRLVWFLRGSPLAFEHYVHRNLGYTVTRHGDAFEMIGSSRLSPQTPEAPSDAAELRAFVAKSLNASSEQEEAFASLLFVQYGHGEYSRKLRSEWGENALAGTVVQVQDGRPVFRISGAGDGPDGGVTIDLDVMNDGNGASHYYSRNMLLVGHIDRHRWGQSVPLVHRQQYGHAKPLGTQPRMLLHEDIHFMCTFGPMWPEEVRGWKMPQNGDCRDLLNLNAVQLVLHHLCTCVRQLGPGLTLQATGEGSSSGSSAAFTRTEVSAAPVRNEMHSQEPPDCSMYTPVKQLVSRPSRLQITERFASEHQQRCHRLPIRNISLCANLAVAHAGSTSLHNWLRKQGAPLAQHNHVTSYECILTTLRDPARRFESSFTFEASHWHDLFRMIETPQAPGKQSMASLVGKLLIWQRSTQGSANTTTPAEWLAAFRDPTHAQHSSVRRVFRESQALRPQNYDPKSRVDRMTQWRGELGAAYRAWGGSNSLVPQLAYLMEANDDTSALAEHVHFVCVERFSHDIRELSSGCDSAAAANIQASDPPHANSAGCAGCKNDAHFSLADYRARATLSEADARFVRECLYPEDTALWRRVCQ